MQDSGQAKHPIVRDKGKKPIVPNDADIPVDDELSSSSRPNPSSAKSNRAKSCKRHLHRPAFRNTDNGLLRQAKRETGREQSQPNTTPGNAYALTTSVVSVMPSIYPAFGIASMPYMLPVAKIRSPDDMHSSPLRQHILDYETPHGFVIPTFIMFNGSTDPYDHMLHYNQATTLNAGDDLLLCKDFPVSLRNPTLAWFHKLPRSSIYTFNELWGAFISQHLCSVRQKRNISSL